MANGMEGLFVGNSGLHAAQNAINNSANNIANVNTKGYVRQQVVMADAGYNFFKSAAVSDQRMGLGVSIGEIVHARDVFLDKSYREEAGRQAYYDAYANAIEEVQSMYQELEGTAFKDVLTGDSSLWTAFQLLAEDPSDTTNQSMVIQRSNLLLTRASAIYSSLSTYQSQINIQISNDIDRVNELGNEIHALNLQIQAIEAGAVETAYDLRDQRDLALDELGSLVNMTYSEGSTGMVTVKVEGQYFIDEARCYEMGKKLDRSTGYVDAYWPHLSNPSTDFYQYVFDFTQPISTDYNTDVGEIKALVQARGNGLTNYTDNLHADPNTYSLTTGLSVMEEAEAQLDLLIHGIATAINDLLCPNTTASFDVRTENADGTYTITSYQNVTVLDDEACNVGSDGQLPPRELFTRVGTERYTKVEATNGKTYYIYNQEDTLEDCITINIGNESFTVRDPAKATENMVTVATYRDNPNGTADRIKYTEKRPYSQYETEKDPKYTKKMIGGKTYWVLEEDYTADTATQYTLQSMNVNDELETQVNLFPHLSQGTMEIDYNMGKALSQAWSNKGLSLYPGSTAKFSFSDYYDEMAGVIAVAGSTYASTSETLYNSVTAIDNQRSQVTGVSTDEELTNMIKYQNAYNAASRYIQTVSDMLDVLVSSLS